MHFAEVLAGQAVGEQAEHQSVLEDRVLVELAAAFHARVAGGDSLVVAAQAERIDVEAVVEEAERAGTHAEVLVIVDHVFVEAFVVRTAERPGRQVVVARAERVENDAVLVGELVAAGGDDVLHALAGLGRDHERVGRDLTRIELPDLLHVFVQHVERLAAEAEHHVDVAGREEFLGILQALEDLFA